MNDVLRAQLDETKVQKRRLEEEEEEEEEEVFKDGFN